MKKITLLLAICFAFQFNAFSQCPGSPDPGFVCVPNADFEQFLISTTTINGPLDGQISIAEASAVVGTLNLGGSAPYNAIDDFTGIEALTGITELVITYNSVVTSIDVSANSSLTTLNVEGCTSMSSITTGANTTLSSLLMAGAATTTIDVSLNSGLTTVDARFSDLTLLDLSNNSALVSLQCRNTSLTSLDMRNGNNANVTQFNSDFNSNLVCIFVDDKTAPYLATWSKDALSTYVDNEGECNTLTLEDANQVVFEMYPNPTKSTVFINANAQDTQLSIYDITGKLVLNNTLYLGQNTVDVSQMTSGIYLARFTANGNVQTKKLIIQ